MITTVYVSIGNSDDKLTQREWSKYVGEVNTQIYGLASQVHGAWTSACTSPFQNAAWCFEISDTHDNDLMDRIRQIREHYVQDSVAWAVVERTEFI